jgi:nickel/cobalt transporter (NicO) family protein
MMLLDLFDTLGRWLLAWQAEFQTALARDLRGVHAGQAAAFWALMATCVTYGFVHAAGPGHGKALLGAYGVARRVGALRLAAIGLASALAQGAVAVALVLVLAGIAGLGRRGIEGVDRGFLAALSLVAVAMVALWLVWRGVARLRAVLHRHHHHHHDHHACETCGHAHLPDPRATLAATTPREVASLIAAVAVRPCSGALILLLLTWQMGLLWVGIAGTLAMALGTGAVAVALAVALAMGRDGLWLGAGRLGAAGPRLAAAIEIAAGLVLLVLVLAMLRATGLSPMP